MSRECAPQMFLSCVCARGTKCCNVKHERHYTIWEAEKLGTEGVKRYICFRMYSRPDDQTKRTVEMSSFMYGFFKADGADQGVACWYAVLSDETQEQAELWMAGAEWESAKL